MGSGDAQKALPTQINFHDARHDVIRLGLALLWSPQRMGDEFQQQSFRRGKGEGTAGCSDCPGFEIGQIRGQGGQGVFAHAFIDQMPQRLNIAIGQNISQQTTTVHRQDSGNCVECFGATFDGGVCSHGCAAADSA